MATSKKHLAASVPGNNVHRQVAGLPLNYVNLTRDYEFKLVMIRLLESIYKFI